MADNKTIGLKIKRIRESCGLTMTDFAKKIDSTSKSGTVSNWETGKNLPNKKRLKQIAKLGGTSIDELLNDDVIISREEYDELLEYKAKY